MTQQLHSPVYTQRRKTLTQRDPCTPYIYRGAWIIIEALYRIAKIWKQPSVY